MSGVHGFIRTKSDQDGRASPQRHFAGKLSAEAAQALKIQPSTIKKLPLHTAPNVANPQPTPPITERFSPIPFTRNTLLQHQFVHQPQDVSSEPGNEGGGFAESIVGSDFEDTNTTINFDPNQDYGNGNGDSGGRYEDEYEDKGGEHGDLNASTQHYSVRDAQTGSRTAGRFLPPQTVPGNANIQLQSNIPIQTLSQIPILGNQKNGSGKRDRRGEHKYNRLPPTALGRTNELDREPADVQDDNGHALNGLPHESDEYDESSNDGNPANHELLSGQNTPSPSARRENAAQVAAIKYTPDYDHDQLQNMSYSVLAQQSFDEVPISHENKIQAGDSQIIEHKMKRIVELSSNEETSDAARACVDSMTVDEWEQGGEWFLDQFSDIVKRLKEAKMEKRKIVSRFEKEIESREKAVSGKRAAFERELQGMQTGAEKLMRGKSR